MPNSCDDKFDSTEGSLSKQTDKKLLSQPSHGGNATDSPSEPEFIIRCFKVPKYISLKEKVFLDHIGEENLQNALMVAANAITVHVDMLCDFYPGGRNPAFEVQQLGESLKLPAQLLLKIQSFFSDYIELELGEEPSP